MKLWVQSPLCHIWWYRYLQSLGTCFAPHKEFHSMAIKRRLPSLNKDTTCRDGVSVVRREFCGPQVESVYFNPWFKMGKLSGLFQQWESQKWDLKGTSAFREAARLWDRQFEAHCKPRFNTLYRTRTNYIGDRVAVAKYCATSYGFGMKNRRQAQSKMSWVGKGEIDSERKKPCSVMGWRTDTWKMQCIIDKHVCWLQK